MSGIRGLNRHARAVAAAAVAACTLAGMALAADQSVPRFPSGIPDFSSNNMGWASEGVEFLPMPGA
jgi:hypothetical protein